MSVMARRQMHRLRSVAMLGPLLFGVRLMLPRHCDQAHCDVSSAPVPRRCVEGAVWSPPWHAVQRRSSLCGALLLAALETPQAASGESTPNMKTTVKIYMAGLQEAADQLIFGLRPLIELKDWEALRDYLRADSMGSSKGYIDLGLSLDRVVVGNEDFLEGAEDANYKMIALLERANKTVWETSDGRQEKLLQIWGDMVGLVSTVIGAVNTYVASEPDLQQVSSYIPLVPPSKDPSKYGRSSEAWQSRCKGIRQAGVCLDIPDGTQQNIAKYTQFGMQVNPFYRANKDGKYGGVGNGGDD
eukprot:TRINITY_DN93428_c0_g1_i1.p1 TRINITY_DN93428_c0_g1~~TRINITY_DN93428_c0_g1_i1.p1  ORF type:complete len:300 (+),score=66.05 TRINITY_DN93428_c0_g1_i1:23-922(+)